MGDGWWNKRKVLIMSNPTTVKLGGGCVVFRLGFRQ